MPSLRQLARDYGVPVGSQIVGGILARRATGNATQNLTTGVGRAMDRINTGYDSSARTMADVYRQQQQTLAPYRATGESALPGLQAGVAQGGEFNKPFTMADLDLYKDPGFQFRLQQGQRAINAGANAGGTRFSGATLKALSQFNQESASQEAQAAYARQQNDLQSRFGRVMNVEGIGERAAGAEVSAGSQYGANLSRLQQSTSQQLADLETDLASAQAAGDIAKANSINDTISGILGAVDNVGTAKSLAQQAGITGGLGTAGTVAGITGAAGGTASAAGIGILPATLPDFGATLAGIGAPTLATGSTAATGGGLGATVGGLLTNPITIAAGVALGVGLLWRKSQAHHEANDFVQGVQNPFNEQMDSVNRGNYLPEQKAELKRAISVDYLAALMNFSKKGSDQAKVAMQALADFKKWYGDAGQFGVTA